MNDEFSPNRRDFCCMRCRMYLGLCFCDKSQPLHLATKVVVFMNFKEYRLITNTGSLACRVLKNSKLVFRGHPDRRVIQQNDFIDSQEQKNAYVLYPSAEAIELNENFVRNQKTPVTLICPDGHWGQAKKTMRHEPSLKNLPHVKLPEGQISHYRLRRNIVSGRVCTFEAIAHALGIIEGGDVLEHLQTIFERMTTRILWTRGKIKRDGIFW